jgi:hypothetical protein
MRDPAAGQLVQNAQFAELASALGRLMGEWNEIRPLVGLGAGITGSRASEVLGVDRGTAQRLAKLSRTRQVTLADLEGVPGVAAWERVVAALEARLGETHPAVQRMAFACDRFASSIDGFGGSRAAVVRALKDHASAAPDETSSAEAVRRAWVEASAAAMGFSMDVRLRVFVYRPNPQTPEMLDEAMLQSMQGCVGSPGAHPLTLLRYRTRDGETITSSSTTEGARSFFLLRHGTSSPPPDILSTGDEKIQTVMVEPTWSRRSSPLDVASVVADRAAGPMPWASPPPILEAETLNRYPTRRLVLLYLLHQDVERGSVATFGAYGDRRLDGLGRPWFDRLPEHGSLRRFDAPLSLNIDPEIPSCAAMLQEMFERLGWDSSPFVAYLARVDAPIPLARYVFTMNWPDR